MTSLSVGVFFSIGFTGALRAQELEPDTVPEKDRVVNIAYGTQPAWLVTGAISTVKGSDLQKSFTSNLANALYGRLAGLTVSQQGGEPGLESPVALGRGIGTYNAGRKLLIMVDGFESNFEQLTPYEIETIALLKDAAATAIYGSRGANGVLLITTKRGTDSPLKVDFTANLGFNKARKLPQFLNAYNYASLYNEALVNEGKPAFYSSTDLEAYRTGSDPYFHPDVNWYDQVMRDSSPISNYNLNFRGGNNVVRYFGLLNVMNNSSLLIKSGDLSDNSSNGNYSRYNFRTNIDVNLTKRITASVTLAGSVEDKANPVGNNTQSLFNTIASITPNAFPVYNPDGSYGGSSLRSNPLGDVLESGQFTSNGRTLQSTLKLTHNLDMITKGLDVSGAISFNNFFRNLSNKTRTYQRFAIADNGSGAAVYTGFGQNTSLVGDESQTEQWRNIVVQGFLNYKRDFGIHGLDAMLMYNSDNYAVSGSSYPYKHIGVGGRFTYSYNARYIGEVSFSYMGSENFAPGKRYGLFPALSLGWIVSEEEFLKDNGLLSYLKLRGSYGLVGNDVIGGDRFLFEQYYRYPAGYFFGTGNTSSSALTEGQLANPDITWEKDRKMNIGLDARFFQRLDVSVDVFRNKRYDILATPNRTLPGLFGVDLPLLNDGRVNNHGFEAVLQFNSKPAAALRYVVGASAWYAKNKIINMSEAVNQFSYQDRTGLSVDQPFGLEAIGFFRDAADISASPKQNFAAVMPGDIKYKDQNGDGVIDVSDNVAIGNTAQPELTLGFNAAFGYKGFDLSFLVQAVTGRSAYLTGREFQAFQNNGNISPIALGRWTPATAATASYPRLTASNNLNNFRYSSFWQQDGSFVNLRSAELGYAIQDALIGRIGVRQARIFINGTNLFSIDRIDHSDAEATPGYIGYPSVRTLSMGLRIGF